jgi:hypothetical protein
VRAVSKLPIYKRILAQMFSCGRRACAATGAMAVLLPGTTAGACRFTMTATRIEGLIAMRLSCLWGFRVTRLQGATRQMITCYAIYALPEI